MQALLRPRTVQPKRHDLPQDERSRSQHFGVGSGTARVRAFAPHASDHMLVAMWRIRAFVAWSVFVWVVLVKNMLTHDEHPLSFRLVHIGLAVVSLSLAASCWPLARRLRQAGSSTGR